MNNNEQKQWWQLETGLVRHETHFELIVTKTIIKTGKIGKKRRRLPLSAGRNDVALTRAELEALIATGGQSKAPARDETLTVYALSWLEQKLPWLKSDLTKERYGEAINNHILPVLGEHLITKIDRGDVQRWFGHWTAATYTKGHGKRARQVHYAEDTINGWWRILSKILRSAIIDKGLKIDPTMEIEPLVAPEKSRRLSNTLTGEELLALMQHAQQNRPEWFAFLYVGFGIGARPGELRPLMFDTDVNLETGILEIHQSQRGRYLGPTKTKKVREVRMPESMVAVLKAHREFLKRTRHPWARSGLVFPGYGGWRPWHKLAISPADEPVHFLSPSALDKPLDEMVKAIGITRPITPKTMRRTFNDLLAQQAVDPLVIRSMTGHRSDAAREKYRTVSQNEQQAASAKLLAFMPASRELVAKGK